ncbi:hypothetical protein ABT095_06200 [Kitasatospora sp. NPDC002227]|uniref:hypothetical protein n=1 Tax=Kitasatospora sp. NPDC002227 TaxID=3154773 RepID=UPI00332075C1
MDAGVLDKPIQDDENCSECQRLRVQERAAFLAGDGSRRTDVRVMRRKHVAEEHSVAEEPDHADALPGRRPVGTEIKGVVACSGDGYQSISVTPRADGTYSASLG